MPPNCGSPAAWDRMRNFPDGLRLDEKSLKGESAEPRLPYFLFMSKTRALTRIPLPFWTTTIAGLFFLVGALAAGDKSETPLAVAGPGPGGARNLTLAPNLSFTDDSSVNFPIRGENLEDGRIASDRPT